MDITSARAVRFLQKADVVASQSQSSDPTLQSKRSLVVLATDFTVTPHKHTKRRSALTTRTHSVSECKAHHDHCSRPCENPPKASSPSTLYDVFDVRAFAARSAHDHTAGEDARDCRSTRGGTDRRRSQVIVSRLHR